MSHSRKSTSQMLHKHAWLFRSPIIPFSNGIAKATKLRLTFVREWITEMSRTKYQELTSAHRVRHQLCIVSVFYWNVRYPFMNRPDSPLQRSHPLVNIGPVMTRDTHSGRRDIEDIDDFNTDPSGSIGTER